MRYHEITEARYPLASKDEWYGNGNYQADGGRMVQMTPDEYLSKVRPLVIDDISRENIDDLKAHIQSGRSLDPLVIYRDGKEDGRHRANAAKELGIKSVPVIVFEDQELDEKAPPSAKAKRFISKHKDEFKDRYGDAWKQVLYATAWKRFS